MQSPITNTSWPKLPDGSYAPANLETRASNPGSLGKLADWGIAHQLITEQETETTVAALIQEGDLELLWQQLVLSFPEHGLWPVWTTGFRDDLARPWLDGELDEPGPVTTTAEAFFAQESAESEADIADDEPPFRFERLAAPTTTGTVHLLAPAAPPAGAGLLVVPVARPADVPATVGWWGAVNYDFAGQDISAVLRSWEDRFGAVLMKLDFDMLFLQVAQPPRDRTELAHLATEFYLFCPDSFDQSDIDIEAYYELPADNNWAFWWD